MLAACPGLNEADLGAIGIECREAPGAGEVVISSEQIGNAIGIGKSAAYRAVLAALDNGFLTNNEIRRGRPFKLTLKQGVDDGGTALLPDPRTINPQGGAA